jgi:U3 small nucleolar RNA-associated protein 14
VISIIAQPTTALESSIDKLLKKAQMREEDLQLTETLKMNHLSLEEVAARRAEVRKVRELMFRAEVKAKRMAKIKSKTYRRIKRKAREREAALAGDDSDDEESRMKHEVDRARERATLRHKNTGKWAKAMHGRGELDEDQRQDVAEMLDRGEKLRRRIRGQKDSGASSSESSDEEQGDVERVKARAFEELEALKGDAGLADLAGGERGKSVFDMKFMRDAAAREQREVDQQVDNIMQGLEEAGSGSENGGDAGMTEHDPNAPSAERVGGRMSFRPGLQVRLGILTRIAPINRLLGQYRMLVNPLLLFQHPPTHRVRPSKPLNSRLFPRTSAPRT